MLQQTTETRCTTTSVSFAASFFLREGFPELPAGSYTVHVHDDVYQGAFAPVYLVTCVELIEKTLGETRSYIVQRQELAEALARDVHRSALVDHLSENPDRGRS